MPQRKTGQPLLNRRIALGFAVTMVLIASGFALSFYAYHRYDEASQNVRQTYQTIQQLEDLLSSMKDVETGVRGYIASGDRLFLEPYRAARPGIGTQVAELRQRVANNPVQRQRVDTLAQSIRDKLDIADRQVRETGRVTPAVLHAYLRLGKVRMDRVRVLTAQMMATERDRMDQRNQRVSDSFRNTLLVTLLLSLLTLSVLVVLYRLLSRELARRQRNEDQLRAYEAQLRGQIQQLQTSNEELERFAFVASHDLQEPLRKIQSFTALVTDRHGNLLNDESTTYLQKVTHSAERMSKLIKDLLNFSRLSNQREPFKPIRLDLVIQRILDDQELRIRGLNARVEVASLPVVDGIESQLEQLFANLIGNALKFTRPDVQPVLRIQTQPVEGRDYPELMPDRPYAQITVEDNGIGFDEKYLDHIFKVFQRLHGKSEYEGTGIGLAICKRVVVYHHGYITARSVPNQGTTFVVILPESQSLHNYDRTNSTETHSYSAG